MFSVNGGSDSSATDSFVAARPRALFNVLGPLEVRTTTTSFEPAGKPAMLLALLLLNANTWVNADQIVAALWEKSAPASASRNIKTYIWQLRRWLPPLDGGSRVEGRRGGYRIRVQPTELDTMILDGLTRDCHDTEAELRARQLASALNLWRGVPYPELPPDITRIAIARHEQVRWELRERLIGALTRCGRHADAIALLQPLVAEDPLREGLWVRLIGALNAVGRRSEALAAYQQVRRLLRDELGVEPGPQLQEAQRQVLAGELPGPADAPIAGESAQLVRPVNLPRDLPDFLGRDEEVRSLLSVGRATSNTPQVAVIDGMPGSGKTALALHVAHLLASAYPDGRVFCNLRCHDPQASPAAPADVLAALLRAFGLGDAAIPSDLEERSALWRSIITDRRVLIVLDDVAGPTQLRPLLPGTGNCLVVATSRRRLDEPDGALSITLEPLADSTALDLLAAAGGELRVRAERGAAQAIVRLCGNLPLAIRLAASRLRQHQAWSVAMLAQRLHREETRLNELRTADRDLALVFGSSYDRLGSTEQRVFRVLGAVSQNGAISHSQDFDLNDVAAQAQLSADELEQTMERLLGDHLVTQGSRTRYGMHDLLRAYARQLVVDAEPVAECPVPARLSIRGRPTAVARTA